MIQSLSAWMFLRKRMVLNMKCSVTMTLEVSPEANFYGSDRSNLLSELAELLYTSIYDIDDVKILDIEVEEE